MKRYAARVDANAARVAGVFRDLGCSVEVLDPRGPGGLPDLLVGTLGQNHLVEVKDGSRKPSERRLSGVQIAWHERWRGERPVVVLSEQEAVELVARWRLM